MSAGAFALGVVWLVLVGAGVARTAVVVARRLAPATRAETVLLGAVIAVGQLTLTGQALGGVSLLQPIPFALAILVEAGGTWWWTRSDRPAAHPAAPPPPTGGVGWLRLVAGAAAAAVGTQWATHAVDALDRGMVHADTLWYHAPYSARFLQLGSLGDVGELGYAQSRYFPLGSELLHAELALPFHRDVLSPLVNLAFFGLALLAAAVFGRRWGTAPTAVLLVTAVLGTPTMAGTQPGQASNDVVAGALVLAGIAIAASADRRPSWFAVAGLALGLAVGTKVTMVATAGVLLAAVAVAQWRDGERRSAAWWVAGAAVPVVAWPLRNLVVVGSPVPFFGFDLGPIHWEAVARPDGTPSLLRDVLDGGTWSYRGGLRNGLGALWPLPLALLAASPIGLVRGPRLVRILAAATAVGALAYTVTPYTGGASFQFNLRYLMPAILLGALVVAVAVAGSGRVQQALTMTAGTVILVDLGAAHHERVAAWPIGAGWVVAGASLAVGAGCLLAIAPRPVRLGSAAVLAVGALWFAQDRHLEHRYVDAGLHDDPLNALFRTVSDARVDVLGTPEAYPFFGADLSNVVRDHSAALVFGTPEPADLCRHWRAELADADLVVLSSYGFLLRRFTPAERSLIFGDAAQVLLDDGERAVYRVDDRLDPSTCPPPSPTAAASGP